MKRFNVLVGILALCAGCLALGPSPASAQGCVPRQPDSRDDWTCEGGTLKLQPQILDLTGAGQVLMPTTQAFTNFSITGNATLGNDGTDAHTANGQFITYRNNASSFRLKGPQAASEGGADVQSYSGIFYNDAYTTKGTLKTRAIHGANLEMDLELQSPHALLLTAVDGGQADGKVVVASRTNSCFDLRADAEVLSGSRLCFDRETTGTTGAANTSAPKISSSSGDLLLSGATRVRIDRQMGSSGTAPVPSSCGTGTPTIVGSDTAWILTLGTGDPGSCVVTFNSTFTNTPVCTLTANNILFSWPAITSASATAITVTVPTPNDSSGVIIYGHCFGQDGN